MKKILVIDKCAKCIHIKWDNDFLDYICTNQDVRHFKGVIIDKYIIPAWCPLKSVRGKNGKNIDNK